MYNVMFSKVYEFSSQKGGKCIVPASRIPEGTATATHPNEPEAARLTN